MTFKPGDKVKFLNDVGGGTVTRITKQTAYVETNDGFEIPTLFSELVKVESVGFGNIQPNPEPVKNNQIQVKEVEFEQQVEDETDFSVSEGEEDDEIITTENSTLNVLLALVPSKIKGKQEPDFSVYLISDCAYRLMYTFSLVRDNFLYGKRAGLVEEDTKVQISHFTLNELKYLQTFKLNCIFYKKGIFLPHEPLIYEYKLDALWLADPANWEENDYFEEKAVVVNVTEMSLLYEIERMVTENEDKFIIQKKRKDISTPKKAASKQLSSTRELEEVDLHVEELIDNHSGMSAGEILDLQVSRFIIALEGAIKNKTKRIVFIHGVGNGRLKYEITKTVERKYPRLRYQDASFKEYGYGATMIIIH
jgi:hypothetical protein